MYIEFDKDYLRELFEQGRTSDKKHRYQPEVIRGYYKCVMFLKRAENVEQLYRIHSLNYEVLQGDKKGVSSVRINIKYRLEPKSVIRPLNGSFFLKESSSGILPPSASILLPGLP